MEVHRHPLDNAPRRVSDIPPGPERTALFAERDRAARAKWLADRQPKPAARPVRAVLSLFKGK